MISYLKVNSREVILVFGHYKGKNYGGVDELVAIFYIFKILSLIMSVQ